MAPRKNPHAAALGRLGGQAKSVRKRRSSQRNGRRGGRPATVGVTDWATFFDAVDAARRTKQFAELNQLYEFSKRPREKALLVATARELANELSTQIPLWAAIPRWLRKPYFVSGIENLKATALLESPLNFRMCNVFVLKNFLDRV